MRNEECRLMTKSLQENFLKAFRHPRSGRAASDRDDLYLGVYLLLHEPLDCHERAAQRTRATAARALVVNRELLVFEREHFEPAAVGREVRPYLLVENLVDAREPRVVAHQSA